MTDYRDMSDDALFDLWCDACRQIQMARRDVFDEQAAKYDGRWKDPYEPHGMGALMSAYCVLDKVRAGAWEIYDELKGREGSKLAALVNDDELYDEYLDVRSDIIDRLCETFGIPPSFKPPTTDRYSIEYACFITLDWMQKGEE